MTSPGWWRPRVYTTVLAVLILAAAAAWWALIPAARGQTDVSVDPTMTRGPHTARVTIFEFSDYE
jgi:hypothetical protein